MSSSNLPSQAPGAGQAGQSNNSVDIQDMEVPLLQQQVARDLMERSIQTPVQYVPPAPRPTAAPEEDEGEVVTRMILLHGTLLDSEGNIKGYRAPKSYTFNNLIRNTEMYYHDIREEVFVERRACEVGLRMLREHNVINIIGNGGDGRSTLGMWLTKKIADEVDCEAVRISSPKDFAKVLEFDPKNGEKLAVMVDDVFGSPGTMKLYVNEWRDQMDLMWQFVRSKDIYFILTSKKFLYHQGTSKMLCTKLFQEDFVLDLTEPALALTYDEKKEMCRNHLRHKGLDEGIAVNLPEDSPTIGFCVTVNRFCNNKTYQKWGLRFFTHPIILYSRDFEILSNTERMAWAVFVLILLGDGMFNPKDEKLPDKKTFQRYASIDDELNCRSLRKTCKQMKNVFITYDEKADGYKFIDHSIEDAAMLTFGKYHVEEISEKATVDFFVDYVVTDRYQCDQPERDILLVFSHCYFNVLSARITKELLECNVEKILCHRAFLDGSWVTAFVTELKESGRLMKVLQVKDRHCNMGVLTLCTLYGLDLLLEELGKSGEFTQVADKSWAKQDLKEALEITEKFHLPELANLLHKLC